VLSGLPFWPSTAIVVAPFSAKRPGDNVEKGLDRGGP